MQTVFVDGTALSIRHQGFATYARLLIRELAASGDNDSVVCAVGDRRAARRVAEWGLRPIPVQDALAESRGDGSSLFHDLENGAIVGRRGRGRRVITLHDMIPVVMPDVVDEGYLWHFAQVCLPNACAADGILTVSHASKRDIVKFLGVPADRVVVTPLVPDVSFCPVTDQQEREMLTRRFRLPRPRFFCMPEGSAGGRTRLAWSERFAGWRQRAMTCAWLSRATTRPTLVM